MSCELQNEAVKESRPEEIADVAVFLASKESRWLTGETLIASGGCAEKGGRTLSAPKPMQAQTGAAGGDARLTITLAAGDYSVWVKNEDRKSTDHPLLASSWDGIGRAEVFA